MDIPNDNPIEAGADPIEHGWYLTESQMREMAKGKFICVTHTKLMQ
jgi:hypothetical protein